MTIAVQDYGSFGQVMETLPEGFQFLEGTLSDAAVGATGNTIKFTLLGEEQFTYTVVAPDSEGEYIFSGVLLDSFRDEREIGGATVLRVGAPSTPTPGSTATMQPTPTPGATRAPTATPTPPPAPVATSTPAPEPAATAQPTATAAPEPTATPEPMPTAEAMIAPAPASPPAPTATAVPVPTATPATEPEPTATPTPAATPMPTPTPDPTATPIPVAVAPDEDDGRSVPLWLVIILSIGGPVIVFGAAAFAFQRRQRQGSRSILPARRRGQAPPTDEEGEEP